MSAARRPGPGDDLRGAARLVVDAVAGVTGIVESMHRNIAGLAPVVGPSRAGRTRGVTGLVYRSIRGTTGAVGHVLDATLARLAPLWTAGDAAPAREAVRAALNGVVGDHLAASGNPLAIPMQLRRDGAPLPLDREALREAFPRARSRLVVLVHGLCMNDLQWRHDGLDHGARLAGALRATPLYLHYNSGLAIPENGRAFASLMERLVEAWPVGVREIVVVGFSMGGLVARSACHHADRSAHAWRSRLTQLVFLGTPHHGAPLERAGHGVDLLLAISPYTAPFARLGLARSAGVKDLRHGRVVDEPEGARAGDSPRRPDSVPLPRGVRCTAIAASRQAGPGRAGSRPWGDGLVTVPSALGQHADPARTLDLPASRRIVCYGLGHLDLLGSEAVGERMRRALGATGTR